MAYQISATPCWANGSTGSVYGMTPRDIQYRAVETPDLTTDSSPHVLVRVSAPGTSLSSLPVVIYARIRVGTGSTYSVQQITVEESLNFKCDANTIYAYKLTIDQIMGFVKATYPQPSDYAQLQIEVTYTLKVIGQSVQTTDVVKYVLMKSDAIPARDRVGKPHFSANAGLERGTRSGSSWTPSSTGPHLKIASDYTRPAHICVKCRVTAQVIELIGGTQYTRWNTTLSEMAASYGDAQTASAGGYYAADGQTALSAAVKVILTLQCNSPQAPDTYDTIDTITMYISYAQPVFEPNDSGNGVAFGMHPSQYSNRLEVAASWLTLLNGGLQVGGGLTLSTAAKTAVLDFVYPTGSQIFGTSQSSLQQRINAMPGTWQIASAYWEIDTSAGTMQVYTATRTA